VERVHGVGSLRGVGNTLACELRGADDGVVTLVQQLCAVDERSDRDFRAKKPRSAASRLREKRLFFSEFCAQERVSVAV
jgi:hypothetical protein